MLYSEITVKTTSQAAELVAYFLQEVCMDGVSIFDKKDLYENRGWDYKDDVADTLYDTEVLVKGYCNKEDTDSVLNFLHSSLQVLDDAGSLAVSVRDVDGDAWVATWKETFKPIETQRMVICPEWQSVTTDKRVLLLDTGIAFGTGQHETTSMCVETAEELCLDGFNVLDVGCGSGILGLTALLLGARHAELVDIDAQAVDIARHNAQINGVADRATISVGNLTEHVEGTFDVVFANLTADILAGLLNDIARVVHKGTLVVLSGILDTKLDGVLAAYGTLFEVVKVRQKGEWRCVLLYARN